MNLKEIPDARSKKYTKIVSFCVSKETKESLEELKRRGKDTSQFLRMVVERSLEEVLKTG